ncbi:MAG: patatin-like phospholipase family protein [Desulfuromonadales bacterium]|jgi:NTE family protein|nr:patatin-like phospholipase family protein [Desulfuromonadales bacterium]
MDAAKSISLVLGSGGARGMAHIGVIQVLEERGFAIRSISGSSIGALVGGIYAAGELDTYAKWVCALERLDVLRLLDLSFSGTALFKGERIINTLRELIGDQNIEDLPISYTAVATDLEKSREVWLSNGPLFDAIRASTAFPTVFSAFHLRGKKLVDGGLLNPIPIAPTLRDLTDCTIAVSLSGPSRSIQTPPPAPLGRREMNRYHKMVVEFVDSLQKKNHQVADDEAGLFDVISKSLDAMQSTIASFKLAAYSPDIVIEIPKAICTIYEFERAKELIEVGRTEAERVLDGFSR